MALPQVPRAKAWGVLVVACGQAGPCTTAMSGRALLPARETDPGVARGMVDVVGQVPPQRGVPSTLWSAGVSDSRQLDVTEWTCGVTTASR